MGIESNSNPNSTNRTRTLFWIEPNQTRTGNQKIHAELKPNRTCSHEEPDRNISLPHICEVWFLIRIFLCHIGSFCRPDGGVSDAFTARYGPRKNSLIGHIRSRFSKLRYNKLNWISETDVWCKLFMQVVQTYCTINSTLPRRVLLLILHMTRAQSTSASLLREVIIGDSHGARMNNIVSYVNQVII